VKCAATAPLQRSLNTGTHHKKETRTPIPHLHNKELAMYCPKCDNPTTEVLETRGADHHTIPPPPALPDL